MLARSSYQEKLKHQSNAEILIDFDILSLIKEKNIFGFSVSF